MPTWIEDCVKTHTVLGYEHEFYNLENCFKDSRYVQECIKSKQWAKAVDYLRVYYLNKNGGIYLDSDVEVFKNFDELLENRMFVGKERNGYLCNGIIGSEPNHPFLKYYLNTVERNFKTDGETFDAGMQFFSEAYYIADREGLGMRIYEPEVLENILKHYYLKSWL